MNDEPAGATVAEIDGGVFGGGVIETASDALLVAPAESVTEAVTVWRPTPRIFVTEAPVPKAPSRLEVQMILPLMLPSSASVAVPEKVRLVP